MGNAGRTRIVLGERYKGGTGCIATARLWLPTKANRRESARVQRPPPPPSCLLPLCSPPRYCSPSTARLSRHFRRLRRDCPRRRRPHLCPLPRHAANRRVICHYPPLATMGGASSAGSITCGRSGRLPPLRFRRCQECSSRRGLLCTEGSARRPRRLGAQVVNRSGEGATVPARLCAMTVFMKACTDFCDNANDHLANARLAKTYSLDDDDVHPPQRQADHPARPGGGHPTCNN